MRAQFSHVVDIAPTIYEVLDIAPPKVVNGFEQLPIDGTSLAYTFADPAPRGRSPSSSSTTTAAAALYRDGWFAGTVGPFLPWDTPGSAKRLAGPGMPTTTSGSSTT